MKEKIALAAVTRFWERYKGRDILIFADIASTKNLVNIFIIYKISNCRRYERGDIAAVNDYVTYERR